MKNNNFLEQPRRGYTREAQLTPYKAGDRSVGMITVILLVLSVLVTACSKPEKQALAGAWQWYCTSGGIAGVNYTPESEGFEAELVFKGNQFTFYKDGKKVTSGTYHIDYDVDEIYESETWRAMNASINKNIYNIPSKLDSWDMPGISCVIGTMYMLYKMYPEFFSKEELMEEINEYYTLMFDKTFDEKYLGYTLE